MIFKIVSREMWEAACEAGEFVGSSDDLRDGYIHFSSAGQVAATARKYYRGVPDLLLVAFDEAALGPALEWEPARGGDLFPHLYAPLRTNLALWQRPLELAGNGEPLIPEDALAC
jgi:uncharacterized protein (DUF952 family)